MLLSFERPIDPRPRPRARPPFAQVLLAILENCTESHIEQHLPCGAFVFRRRCCKNYGYHRIGARPRSDHRQDIKGTWWMPWHQESMKGVDGCDKPR
jgi:hypothetical protein